ncbi:hypothetical protein V2B23_29470 [Rhodococcus sp. 24CO]
MAVLAHRDESDRIEGLADTPICQHNVEAFTAFSPWMPRTQF